MLNKLFKFPIIMFDQGYEERKLQNNEDLGLKSDVELDPIIGFAECPYWDFISVSDRWQPGKRSVQSALDGNFDACGVIFSQSGSYTVPWTREKFKKEFQKFLDEFEEEEDLPTIKIQKESE